MLVTGAARTVLLVSVLLVACADPSGLPGEVVRDPTVFASGGPRNRPPPPDSIGIPPSIPPVYEEVPAGFNDSQ